MNITIVQLSVEYKNKAKNIAAVSELLAKVDCVGEVTILPEMFSTGYIFNDPDEIHSLSEEFDQSETIRALTELATTYNTVIVAGIAERDQEQYYNSVAVIDGDGVRHQYRKISQNKIDKRYFSRGTQPLIFEQGGLKFGVAVCFDVWFPELTRAYQGVDVLLHPANFGGQHSFSIAQARAMETGCHIVTCNRVGQDVTEEFTAQYCGLSKVFTPQGEVLVELDQTQCATTVSIDDLTIAPQYNGIDLDEEIRVIQGLVNGK